MNLRKLNTREEFEAYVEETRRNSAAQKRRIYVCCGSVCLSEGAMKIYNKFQGQLEAMNVPVEVSMDMHLEEKSTDLKKTGCPGFCNHGPLVRIDPEGWVYTKVQPEDVDEIIEKSVLEGKYIERLGYDDGFDIIKRKKDV
ncbi:MAG: (2Fe-2S) ferredoxin domain-containing protein, partial [Oscillospiraceae bacterium]|nr:(2Fe-2S) ferredoxin domain-containing protein [Oscillospiraceae bacterium]